MTTPNPDMFAEELVFGAKRRAGVAVAVAIMALLIAALAVLALMAALPLKETRVHVLLVDPEPGVTERLAAVQQAPLQTERAISEANLVAYVTDRETFDLTDSEGRTNDVLSRSTGNAAKSLAKLWSSDSDHYLLDIYHPKDRILVKVRAVSFLDTHTAQVRFIKRLINKQGQEREAAFVATIGFEFEPRSERKIEAVWKNPFGFRVVNYRVDAETLEGGRS